MYSIKRINTSSHLLFVMLVSLLFARYSHAQTSFVAYLNEIESTECPASSTNFGDDLYENLPSGITFSGLTRNVVGCQSASSHYRSTNFNSSSKANAISENRYVSWRFTASAAVEFTLSSIALRHERSNAGGDNGAIYYSINGAAFEQVGADFTVNTSNGRTFRSFASPVSIPADGYIEFRFYGWATSTTGGGNVRLKGGVNFDVGTGISGTFTPTANPAVIVSENFNTFFQPFGSSSSTAQSFEVSGSNLTNNIVINPPASGNYEIALNEAGPYQTTAINLTPSSGTVANTNVFVRLATGLPAGTYDEQINITSDAATSPDIISLEGEIISETLPYFEDFGTVAGEFPLGWTTSGPGAANWTIGTSTSSNIPSASGGANLQDNGNIVAQEAIITLDRAINTIGASSVSVSFIARKTGAYSGNVELDFSTDGDTWNNVPFADVSASASWESLSFQLPAAAANVTNLRLRLRTTRTNTSGNYRIDDFTVFAPTVYTYTSGPLHSLSSWEDNSSSNPSSFSDDEQIFEITGNINVSTSAPFSISGNNSLLILGDGTHNTTLTVSPSSPYEGEITLLENATLSLQDGNLPEFVGIDENSTIRFEMNEATTIPSVAFGHLYVSGSGTKTFPNSTIALNGNLTLEDVTVGTAGSNTRWDVSRNISLLGTVNYNGALRPSIRYTANDNIQTVTTGTNTLEVFNFEAQNKTGGSLEFTTGQATIDALNNLRLNFSGSTTFIDGGNTITYGDDLRLQGESSSYILSGTIRLNAVSGTNDIENYDDIELNNVEFISGSGATTNLPNFKLIIGGNLLLDGEMNFGGSNAALDLGGNVTLQNTVEYGGTWRPNVQFIGNNAQVINTGTNTFEAFNFYAEEKTGGSLTLAAGNANILALNNLRLDFPAGITFNDGGNTIVYSDDLRIQGDADSYTFTGTLRLIGQNSGDHDFDFVDAALNNLEIILNDGGSGRARMNRGTASNIIVNGDFTYNVAGSYSNMPMGSTTLAIGGNFTDNSSEDKINEQSSTISFFGSSDSEVIAQSEFNILSVEKTGAAKVIAQNNLTIDDDLNIAANGIFEVPFDISLSINGDVNNNGTLLVKHGGTILQSASSSYLGSGQCHFEVDVNGTIAGPGGRQMLIGAPMNDVTTAAVNAAGANRFWFFNETAHQWQEVTDNTTALNGRALLARTNGSETFVFTSDAFNNGEIIRNNLTRTGSSNSNRGYHNISNPYPSFLDWNSVVRNDVSATYMIRTHNSGSGSNVRDFYSANSGIGTNNNGDGALSRYIAPGQGFEIRVLTDDQTNASVTFNNSMRSHQTPTSNVIFNQPMLARLRLYNGLDYDEQVVFFHENADNGFDAMDTEKSFLSDYVQFFSLEDNRKLVMNGLNNPLDKGFIQLGYVAVKNDTYSIRLDEVTMGENLYLLDKEMNILHDLRTGEYSFDTEEGTFSDRFELHFDAILSTSNINKNNNPLVFKKDENTLYIQVSENNLENASVAIYNIQGALVYNGQLSNETSDINLSLPKGVFVVKLISNNMNHSVKIVW